MEMIGSSFLDEEWESLSQIFSNSNCEDFLLQHCHGIGQTIPSSFPSHHQTNFSSLSQESSNNTEFEESLFLNINGNDQDHDHHNFDAFDDQSMNFHNMENAANFMLQTDDHSMMEDFLFPKGENRALETADSSQIKRKLEAAENEETAPQNPKKKPRFSRNNAQKSKTVQSKKGKKTVHDNNDDNNNNDEEIMINRQSCSSYSSEDESNASQELNEDIKNSKSNSNTKARASRGSATDPQSLYARKRRERINERLKILQNLVPNGTKVDISTMLEEAVDYVKFLQLQIKLLSSDNLWMYAPLAYNGMDIGMYQKICPNLRA